MTNPVADPGDPRERDVTLVGPTGPATGRLRWELAGRDSKVTLNGPLGRFEAVERDNFEALARIRERLEPAGWRIAVQGARRNAYASGALRDQGGALKVYIVQPGRPARREDLVRIFDDADPADLATVAEQDAFVRQWREAMRNR